jgi:carbonic anhydrase
MRNWFKRLFGWWRRKPVGDNIRDAIEGHQRFKQHFAENKAFYQRLAQRQHPRLLWIGCSDSRVAPDIITGADMGELFVVRNVANVVPPAEAGDASVGAAIEYAVTHLNVEDIVVCGHSGCGGVKALLGHDGGVAALSRRSHLRRWIEFIRPAQRSMRATGLSEEGRIEAAVKANVLWQVQNVLTYPCVRDAYDAGRVKVHAWYYDMKSGDLYAADEDGDFELLTEHVDA